MDQNQTPTNPQADGAAPQIDQALIDARAEEIAQAKVEQMKEELAAKISGKSDYEAPKSWEELENRSVARSTAEAERIADEKVKAVLAARDKEEADKQKQTLEQTKAQQESEWKQNTQQWTEAVKDGIIPDIAPEIKQKLTADPDYSHLTPEEQNDPGLKAYNNGIMLHAQLKQKGESTSLYRTYAKFYNKMPAGANAPVLGGSTPTPAPTEELDYAKIQENRKKHFGF